MNDVIKSYFDSKNIEYYAVLSYSDCKEINKSIMDREDFKPKSVILFLLPYYTGETENISRYAASLDYHIGIRDVTDGLIAAIKTKMPLANAKGYGDHSPINEVHASLISGLGIMGDNGLLINEKYGTYVFIGDVVTDIQPELLGASFPGEIGRCEGCAACKRACPTGTLCDYSIECLSAVTQKKGELSENEVHLMRKYNTVWGCDMCQSACPHNKNPKITPIEFFHIDRISRLDSPMLSAMDKETFCKRVFAWRGRKTVQRNLELLDY